MTKTFYLILMVLISRICVDKILLSERYTADPLYSNPKIIAFWRHACILHGTVFDVLLSNYMLSA